MSCVGSCIIAKLQLLIALKFKNDNIYKFYLPPQIVGEKGWYYGRWKHEKIMMLALLTCVYHYQR